MTNKTNMKEVLEELMKASVSCYCCFDKSEGLSELDMNEAKNELEKVKEKVETSDKKVFAFSDGKKKEVANELVTNHPESLLNGNMTDLDSRNSDNEVEIDFRFKYL